MFPSRTFPSLRRRHLAFLPIALVLIITACGGDDDDAAAPVAANSGNYEADLTAIIIDVENRLDAETDGIPEEIEQRGADEDADSEEAIVNIFKDVLRDVFPRTFGIIEDGIDRLEDLNPTSQFAADHDRFVQGVKDLLDVQRDILRNVDDIESVDDFEGFGDRGEAVEAELEASLSPAFLALVAAFFEDDDDENSDSAPGVSSAPIPDDDGTTLSDGTNTLSTGDDLPDAYPQSLIPPQSTLTSSLATDGPDGANILTFWNSTASAKNLLDFFEDGFEDVGIRGETNRFLLDDAGSLEFVDGDGETLAGVLITGGEDDSVTLIVTLNNF
ncbi:MAG TPA: hypothetical protein QGF05_01340 [Dehalococcoidia bacterium]|nr:hypothetical protein [Dehalococcoidia bacterium]